MDERANTKTYDAVVIGFGKGGKTLAGALGAAGRTVAIVEQSNKMYGGTCINVGCIPTKLLVNRARSAAKEVEMAAAFEGAAGPDGTPGKSFEDRDRVFRDAMKKKEELVTSLRGKNYGKLDSNPNVTVIDGTASFESPHVVKVVHNGETQYLEGAQIFINTGSSSWMPPIDGLKDNPYVHNSDGILSLEKLPKSLVIIGGGYIGMEFSSIFADFGSKVTILQDGAVFLPREDTEIAEAVWQTLADRGIEVITGVRVTGVEQADGHALVVTEDADGVKKLPADAVLVATGRRPNTAGLNLEAAGVETDARGGIVTDDHLATTAPHIYAMGDVRGGLQFTYLSLDDYRIVKSAVLGDGSYTLSKRGAVPYSVFLRPAFSRVGMSEKEALAAGYRVKVGKLAVAAIPKAQVLEEPVGLLKAVVDEESGRILGAHLFCQESYEMINLVKLAMDAGLPYTALRDNIFTHPTMSEALNDLFTGI